MRPFTLVLLLFITSNVFAAPAVVTEFIKIDQFGYRTGDEKVAVITDPQTGYNAAMSFAPGNTFQIRNWSDDAVVFTGTPTAWNGGAEHTQSGDRVWWFDFSTLTAAGEYYVYDTTNDVGSHKFAIADDVYNEVLRQAVRTFYFQRCGTAKTAAHGGDWTDAVCHHGAGQDLACRSVLDQNNPATEKDLSGGWHDAGDYNKYVAFTNSTLHSMLFAYRHYSAVFGDDYNIPESGNGIPDILDEIMYELDWLKKMQLADGSVLTKVSVTQFQGSSPPSSDAAARYYGPAVASSTAIAAGIFAHAAAVLSDFPALAVYADDLEQRAEDAWAWIQANPAYSAYDNAGFFSAGTARSVDEQKEDRVAAAMLLFEVTGEPTYQTFVDNNYTDIRPVQWTFWYPFQSTVQNIALHYAALPAAAGSTATALQNSFTTSTTANNGDMLPAYNAQTDAYRAYLKNNDYVWGSNSVKADAAVMYNNMNLYDLDAGNAAIFENAALGYVHYLHGVNPQAKVMLTNMTDYEAENSCDEMYHVWFADGTDYDNAQTSLYGPPPGYVTGGANPNYAPDNAYSGPPITPPQSQPVQKSYKDWNTSYPQNSWTITENAIYYQAAYVQMLAAFAAEAAVLPLELSNFSARLQNNRRTELSWQVLTFEQTESIEIERKTGGDSFVRIGALADIRVGRMQFFDNNPVSGTNYYRLKIKDTDGSYAYSSTVQVQLMTGTKITVSPNPAGAFLTIKMQSDKSIDAEIQLIDTNGKTILTGSVTGAETEFTERFATEHLPRGVYYLRVLNAGESIVLKVVLR